MERKLTCLFLTLVLLASIPVMAQQEEGKVTIGAFGSAKKMVGDDVDQDVISPWFGGTLGYTVEPGFTLTLSTAYGVTYPRDPLKTGSAKWYAKYPNSPFKTVLLPILLNVQTNLRPESKLNPYIAWGMGALIWDLQSNGTSVHGRKTDVVADIGPGVQWFLADNLALDLSLHYQHFLTNHLDRSGYGDVQTGNIEPRLGINILFGGNRDSDGDGILNKLDKCPKVAEDMDGFQDEDGCPELDNDGDGIADLQDKCPTLAEDKDAFQDEDGCPDLDNDADGVPDAQDKCPTLAEDKDAFQDEDGCPDLDNDGDGIPDLKDKCPDQPETVNGFKDEDGCPDKKPEVVIEKKAPIVLEGVNFETGSAVLVPGAKTVLDKVIETLSAYPEMQLEVRGYTDNVGRRLNNVKLSQRRADAVKAYMTGKGIAGSRIQTKGFGPDNPVAPNTTVAGRLKNRRIEFIRVD